MHTQTAVKNGLTAGILSCLLRLTHIHTHTHTCAKWVVYLINYNPCMVSSTVWRTVIMIQVHERACWVKYLTILTPDRHKNLWTIVKVGWVMQLLHNRTAIVLITLSDLLPSFCSSRQRRLCNLLYYFFHMLLIICDSCLTLPDMFLFKTHPMRSLELTRSDWWNQFVWLLKLIKPTEIINSKWTKKSFYDLP